MMGFPESWSPFMASLRTNADVIEDYEKFKAAVLGEWQFRGTKEKDNGTPHRVVAFQTIKQNGLEGELENTGTENRLAPTDQLVPTAKRRDILQRSAGRRTASLSLLESFAGRLRQPRGKTKQSAFVQYSSGQVSRPLVAGG